MAYFARLPTTASIPPVLLIRDWSGSALKDESTLHQLSPYIGKLKSSIASSLIEQFSQVSEVVYDPFSGSGTVALEAWAAGRQIIANDLSPYAAVLTRAKLFPYDSLESALDDLEELQDDAASLLPHLDLRRVPIWVREFFHPRTLREVLAWTFVLRQRRRWFLLASLLGILHHQRPGFLSYPSSHTVPYLRKRAFPPGEYPLLYEYRSLADRFEAKVIRAFRRVPKFDYKITRQCHSKSAHLLTPDCMIDSIITSPPYMRQLDYGRDNRLRLWFLGVEDSDALDQTISPRKIAFFHLLDKCFRKWNTILKPGGYCVLVVGDGCSELKAANLPSLISELATQRGFEHVIDYTEMIPNERRVRRGLTGSTSETVLILRNRMGKPN